MLFSLLFFTAALVILYFVVRHRVHVHIYIEFAGRDRLLHDGPRSAARKRQSGKGGRRAESSDDRVNSTATTRPAQLQETTPIQDLQSALVNLGAKPHRAKAAAQHVYRNWPDAGFEAQFREALKEVQAA